METAKFTRKPFDVEAVQITAENFDEVAEWCQGRVITQEDGSKFIKVRVLRVIEEKQTQGFVGDWILYAGTGYKVYTDRAFRKSFVQKTDELRSVTIAAG